MKKFYPALIAILFFFQACSKDEEVTPQILTDYEKSIISYFKEVALGFEFGNAPAVTRKWGSKMQIFVGGKPNAELLNELKKVTDEINSLATDGFSAEIVKDSVQSNYYVFIGSGNDFAKKFPNVSNLVSSNFGLFFLFFDGTNKITRGYMYVDNIRANVTAQKHLLREELTQSLGLAKDSPLYQESIFQSKWTLTTEYAPIDRDLIRLLYHPRISPGLNGNQVEQDLTEILLND